MKNLIATIVALVITNSNLYAQNNLIFKVGSGKERMPLVEFKSQNYCRIESNNDSFYLVKSATVYFIYVDSLHSRFPDHNYKKDEYNYIFASKINSNSFDDIRSQIDLLQSGDKIVFDDIIGISKSNITIGVNGRLFTLY